MQVKRIDNFLYIVFDVETMLLPVNENGEREHRPNLICASHRCRQCKDMEQNYNCTVCGNAQGNRDFVFHDMETFINHVLEQGPKFQKVVALSHNGARFDTLLVARSLIENQNLSPGIIAQGQKIIQLTVNNIIFRDTYLFMGGKLADLPKTMGLQDNLKKGDFPFLFNTPENQNYDGPWPDIDYFDIDSKSEDERKKLLAWHEECVCKELVFNFQRELLEYCKNDVLILTKALIQFSNLIEERTGGLQCFLQTSTIAACAMQCFRSQYHQ